MITHEFSTSSNLGGIGEAIFLLLAREISNKVISVSEVKDWQLLGIDFIVDTVHYDTKLDLKATVTGNMAIETISRKVEGRIKKEGWFYTTKADCIVYIFREDLSWKLFFFTLGQLKTLVHRYKLATKEVFNYGYTSEVILVPLSELKDKKSLEIPIVNFKELDLTFFRETHEFLKRRKDSLAKIRHKANE